MRLRFGSTVVNAAEDMLKGECDCSQESRENDCIFNRYGKNELADC